MLSSAVHFRRMERRRPVAVVPLLPAAAGVEPPAAEAAGARRPRAGLRVEIGVITRMLGPGNKPTESATTVPLAELAFSTTLSVSPIAGWRMPNDWKVGPPPVPSGACVWSMVVLPSSVPLSYTVTLTFVALPGSATQVRERLVKPPLFRSEGVTVVVHVAVLLLPAAAVL